MPHLHLKPLQWRHNERNGVSNHRCLGCLLDRLFRRRSRRHLSSTSMAFVKEITDNRWILSQRPSNAENGSNWWRHHEITDYKSNDVIEAGPMTVFWPSKSFNGFDYLLPRVATVQWLHCCFVVRLNDTFCIDTYGIKWVGDQHRNFRHI